MKKKFEPIHISVTNDEFIPSLPRKCWVQWERTVDHSLMDRCGFQVKLKTHEEVQMALSTYCTPMIHGPVMILDSLAGLLDIEDEDDDETE